MLRPKLTKRPARRSGDSMPADGADRLFMKTRVTIGLIVALVFATVAVAQDETPSQLYGQLFEDAQMQRVFPDGKTFVDAVPHEPPAIVMQRYQDERRAPGFDLAAFIRRNFSVQRPQESTYARISTTCGTCSNASLTTPGAPRTRRSSRSRGLTSSRAGASTRSTIG